LVESITIDKRLVGGDWNIFIHFSSFHGNFIIPTDEVHHFSEGLAATTNQF